MKLSKFILIANAVALLSKDPATKVGALMVDRRGAIRAQGFNGFPRGIDDAPERYADRNTKLRLVAHAEANAIANAASVGTPLFDCSLVVTKFPCHECAKLIINAGIRRVYSEPIEFNSTWVISNNTALEMFKEAGVEVIIHKEIEK